MILFLGKQPPGRHHRDVNLRLAIALLLLTVSTASGLTIVGYDPAVNDRFASGYASAPVGNSSLSFLGNGYDLSGVGWSSTDSTRSFAMISDQYFVYANHHGPGSTLNFFSPTLGSVVSYGVSNTYNFTFNGQTSDFAIGMLSSALDGAHGITSYPILDLPFTIDYLGLPALIYGHGSNGPRLGANTVDVVLPYNFPGGTGNDSYGIGYSYNSSLPGDSMFESGDSSSPTFIPWHGQLALVGTHSVTGTISDTPYSIDNLIAVYLDQMTTQGIDFSVVPEPSRAMLLLVGACAVLRRRHRAPRE
ncbi:MAG: PEP-CTERM sorting domain-containing protein [Prosthecobacter sp.]|nr:PEP-CTERM sorting domain-containing protein [Prosthecobacter sp.]